MPLAKPQAQPGFLSQATQTQAAGAWYAGNLVRWRNGLLEKIGGWKRKFKEPFLATIRELHAWSDLHNYKNLMVATDLGVEIVVQDTRHPLGAALNLQGGYIPVIGPTGDATTFSVTVGTKTITVKTNIPVEVGTSFVFRLPISIGGRIIAAGSFFTIKDVVTGGFTFDITMDAAFTETDTYGVPLLTNDILNAFTVTWKNHGFVVGGPVRFAQPTLLRLGTAGTWKQVNFVAPADTVLIVDTVPSVDTFTFKMGPLGIGDGLGGTDHQVFVGSRIEHHAESIEQPLASIPGAVIGIPQLRPLSNSQKQHWYLDNLGEDGMVLLSGGPLEVYTPPNSDGPFLTAVGSLVPISAPQQSNGMMTAMPQAQVILWGSEPLFGQGMIDPLLVRWSDVGTYDVWVAHVNNQAGSYRLSRGSKIVGGIQAPQTTILLTDLDLWTMSYIGPPLIYGFTVVGTGCGLIAPKAIATLGRTTVWQSEKNFWRWGDTGAQILPCSVWDFIFDDLDSVNINKCFAASNSTTNEIAFFFPSRATFNRGLINLLLASQDFADSRIWIAEGVEVGLVTGFRTKYVYEPQYVIEGWPDDSGVKMISWWDRDLQGELTALLLAPDDTPTATKVSELSTNGSHSLTQEIFKQDERTTYTFSLYVDATSTRNITLRASSLAGNAYATFDVIHGRVLNSGASGFDYIRSYTLPNDQIGSSTWRRFAFTFVSDDAPALDLSILLTNDLELSYQGEGEYVYIWGAQLNLGELADYKKTGTTRPQNECNRYVKFNLTENAWDSGELTRTAWIDNSIWGTPLGADSNNLVQQHEHGYDNDDKAMQGVYAETGYTELGDGSIIMLIDQVEPDFKWLGRDGVVDVRLRAKNYSGGPEHLYGPYTMTPGTQFFSPRVRAKYVAVRYEWEPKKGYSARVGVTTYRIKPAGRLP